MRTWPLLLLASSLLGGAACTVGESVVGAGRPDAGRTSSVSFAPRVPAVVRGRFELVDVGLRTGGLITISLGDCDGDGDLDLADHRGVLFEQLADGSFVPRPERTFEGFDERSVELGDVNGDGTLDLLVCGDEIELRLGHGAGASGRRS